MLGHFSPNMGRTGSVSGLFSRAYLVTRAEILELLEKTGLDKRWRALGVSGAVGGGGCREDGIHRRRESQAGAQPGAFLQAEETGQEDRRALLGQGPDLLAQQ